MASAGAAQIASRNQLAGQGPLGARKTVLLADDSEVALNVLARMVEQEGCDVVLASSGEKAIEEFQRTSPVPVFTDWEMPEMSGVHLASRLRKLCDNDQLAHVPIIAVTGHTDLTMSATVLTRVWTTTCPNLSAQQRFKPYCTAGYPGLRALGR